MQPVRGLQVEPELGAGPQRRAEGDRRLRRDLLLAVEDLRDRLDRAAEDLSELRLAPATLLELVAEVLAGEEGLSGGEHVGHRFVPPPSGSRRWR
jgi:hypothetical protein